ncbi:aromatic ring-hydroxylating dioxygenase subunit alpha [Sphingobium sp. DEHP117]|nr:Rieske 2Fe-2S domain-containing protein [Sphingobium sp. DEHP117]MDQ4420367.1 aromatic ring-hydroxylating dioxygenase subunit alpha [Sphingobium sp. DEHP117]
MTSKLPSECIERGPRIKDIDFAQFRMHVSTDRYHCPAFHARERERLWMRIWQVAARPDDIPQPGDWTEYRIFDQSFILVRGKDNVIRGFVNACRHRGFALCEGHGKSARFTCLYHNWSYGLDGKLLAVPKPDYDGPVEDFVGSKDQLGLRQVPVECFAGFIFLNPDPDARPLKEYLGEFADLMAPYHLDEMVPVGINVIEAVDCNWKIVMDAFQEAYHLQGIHPDLVSTLDETNQRYGFFGDHSVSSGPFGDANLENYGPEDQAQAMRRLMDNFPGIALVLPRFDELLDQYRNSNGELAFPAGVTTRRLFQQATRESLEAKGLDLAQLSDAQMIDSHFYVVFPNIFISARAGEALVIISYPHPDVTLIAAIGGCSIWPGCLPSSAPQRASREKSWPRVTTIPTSSPWNRIMRQCPGNSAVSRTMGWAIWRSRGRKYAWPIFIRWWTAGWR